VANLVLRTVYIDADIDDELRTEAFDTRTSKNDLLRKYLRLGMEVARQRRLEAQLAEQRDACSSEAPGKPRPAAMKSRKAANASELQADTGAASSSMANSPRAG
jgi:hypothetical protein